MKKPILCLLFMFSLSQFAFSSSNNRRMNKRKALATVVGALVAATAQGGEAAYYRPKIVPPGCDNPRCFVKETDLAFCVCGDLGPLIAGKIGEGAIATPNSAAGQNLFVDELQSLEGWDPLSSREHLATFIAIANQTGTEWITPENEAGVSLYVAESESWSEDQYKEKYQDPISVADSHGTVQPDTKLDIPTNTWSLTTWGTVFPFDGTASGSGSTNENAGVSTYLSAALLASCLAAGTAL